MIDTNPSHREVKINPSLISEVRKYGKFDVQGCFNCGSCTVSCELSKDSSLFPRRPIQYAIIGLRDPLHESLEPWLCHDCGNCSTTCPQQAEPREAFSTLRCYLTAQYDWTGLSSKIYQSKKWAIGAPLFVGSLVLLLILIYHLYIVGIPLSEFTSTPIGLTHMFDTITQFTIAVILIPLIILASHAFQMYRFTMGRGVSGKIPLQLYLTEAKTMILHMVTQKQMRECPEKTHKIRWIKHFLIASGCVLMLFLLVFFLRWFQTDNIYPVFHPQRWLGYLVTAFLLFGTVDILISRTGKRGEVHKFSELTDFTLPILLLLTALTGIAVHLLRYSGLEQATLYAYALHLAIAVPMLVIEMPFGRWSHMLYRPMAIYFQSVREKAMNQQIVGKKLEAA